MKKFLCGMVAVCAIVLFVYVVCQDTKEETFVVPVSELSEINEHFWGGYVEVVYNGETYVGDYSLFDVYHATLESVTLRKTNVFCNINVSCNITATKFKEIEY